MRKSDYEIGNQLKGLRERSGLSVRGLAALLKMQPTTYWNYEKRYKKPYLPWELVEKLIPIFMKHGIERKRVIALAGIKEAIRIHDLYEETLQNIIRKTELALEEDDIHLKPDERAQLYVTMFQIAGRHYPDGLTNANPAFMNDFSRAIAEVAKKGEKKK